MNVFQPWYEVPPHEAVLTGRHRTTVHILHVEAGYPVSPSPQRSSSNLQRIRLQQNSTVENSRGAGQQPLPPLMLETSSTPVTGTPKLGTSPHQHPQPQMLRSEVLCHLCMAAATAPTTSTAYPRTPNQALGGQLMPHTLSPPSAGPSNANCCASSLRQRDRYLLDVRNVAPVDVLKAFRVALGLNHDNLSFAVDPAVSLSWEDVPVTPQTLYDVEERQLHTIEATAEWMKQAYLVPNAASASALDGPMLRPLFVIHRGSQPIMPRSHSCDLVDFGGSLTTPVQLLSNHGSPSPPGMVAGASRGSSAGSPPCGNPSTVCQFHQALSAATVSPPSIKATTGTHGSQQTHVIVSRVRENSMVGHNGSLFLSSSLQNASMVIREQQSFFGSETAPIPAADAIACDPANDKDVAGEALDSEVSVKTSESGRRQEGFIGRSGEPIEPSWNGFGERSFDVDEGSDDATSALAATVAPHLSEELVDHEL